MWQAYQRARQSEPMASLIVRVAVLVFVLVIEIWVMIVADLPGGVFLLALGSALVVAAVLLVEGQRLWRRSKSSRSPFPRRQDHGRRSEGPWRPVDVPLSAASSRAARRLRGSVRASPGPARGSMCRQQPSAA